jgi:hypothetical protein
MSQMPDLQIAIQPRPDATMGALAGDGSREVLYGQFLHWDSRRAAFRIHPWFFNVRNSANGKVMSRGPCHELIARMQRTRARMRPVGTPTRRRERTCSVFRDGVRLAARGTSHRRHAPEI